jgi:ER membrane protein complex subunit 3
MQQEFVADLRVRLLWNHNTDSYARSMFDDAGANASALHSLASTLRVSPRIPFSPLRRASGAHVHEQREHVNGLLGPSLTAMDVVLDQKICFWVLIPISVAALVAAVVQHYALRFLIREPRKSVARIRELSAISRASALQNAASILQPAQFEMRRSYFMASDGPLLSEGDAPTPTLGDLSSSDVLMNQSSELVCAIVPRLIMCAWVRYLFDGIAVCRVPFPLSEGFRGMLQLGIERAGQSLSVHYIGPLSWYLINAFGNTSLVQVLVSSDTEVDSGREQSADKPLPFVDQFLRVLQGMEGLRGSAREGLEAVNRHCILPDIERRVLASDPASIGESEPKLGRHAS